MNTSLLLPFLKAIYPKTQNITGRNNKKTLPINNAAGIKQIARKILKKTSFITNFIANLLCQAPL